MLKILRVHAAFPSNSAYLNTRYISTKVIRLSSESLLYIPIFFSRSQSLYTLRKHAFSNILKFHQKTESFQTKKSDIFHISAENIDCGYSLEPPCRGGSNEYPLSMFLSRNTKNNVYLCNPQFYYITVGFMGVKII